MDSFELSRLFLLADAIVADPRRLQDFLSIARGATNPFIRITKASGELEAAIAALKQALDAVAATKNGDLNVGDLAPAADRLAGQATDAAKLAAHALRTALESQARRQARAL